MDCAVIRSNGGWMVLWRMPYSGDGVVTASSLEFLWLLLEILAPRDIKVLSL